MPTSVAYIGLGSNLGDRRRHLEEALARLGAHPLVSVEAVSGFYRTAPMYVRDQPEFVNACAALRTQLAPGALLALLLRLESMMGRVRRRDKGPRLIDLDVLVMGARIFRAPGLELPHPGLPERAFVLEPLAELAPGLVVPGQGGATVAELLGALSR